MSNDDTQSTSGYVTGIGGDLSFQSGRPDNAFMNISECYVSRSGFTRLFTAVRYGKRYMLKCLKEDFRYTPVYHQVNPAKRNVLDLKNETCKNREKRNVLKISHTRHFKTTKKQSKTGCFYSF